MESRARKQAVTNESGSYIIAGLPASSVSVTASKTGYVSSTKTVTIDGNVQLDMLIGRTVDIIAGSVYDTADRPLAGATVEVLDGPQTGTTATTDSIGKFTLTGQFDETTRFRATRDGHKPATKTLNPVCQACNPQRQIFFALDVLAEPVHLAGDYELTIVADSGCTGLPENLRTRTYAATIKPSSFRPTTSFNLVVSGPPFAANYASLGMSVAGDYVAFYLGDLHGAPGFVEQVGPDTYLALEGSGTLTVPAGGSTISTSYGGFIEYCELKGEMGSRYYCDPAKRVAQASCTASRHRLTLVRR